MSLHSPRDLHQALASAFNARDLNRLLALYEPDGVLVPEPGSVASGLDSIRAALAGFLALPGEMQVETVYAIESADLALARTRWEIRNGDQVSAAASGTEIMRRNSAGEWHFVVDHPFGAEAYNRAVR